MARSRRGNILDDQPVDLVRSRHGDQVSHGSAHRVADKRDLAQTELLKQADDIVAHQLEGVGSWPVTAAVAAQVQGEDAVALGEPGGNRRPCGALLAESVQQQHRRGVRGTADLIGQADPADRDLSLLAHQPDDTGGAGPALPAGHRHHGAGTGACRRGDPAAPGAWNLRVMTERGVILSGSA